jgi:hypothetical protein
MTRTLVASSPELSQPFIPAGSDCGAARRAEKVVLAPSLRGAYRFFATSTLQVLLSRDSWCHRETQIRDRQLEELETYPGFVGPFDSLITSIP